MKPYSWMVIGQGSDEREPAALLGEIAVYAARLFLRNIAGAVTLGLSLRGASDGTLMPPCGVRVP